MIPIDQMPYHPTSEKLVEVLCARTQNDDPLFFRIHVAYYWAVVASMMRCQLATLDRGKLPVNLYAINLATSGAGKGLSTNVMEEQVLAQFFEHFIEETFPQCAATHLPVLANNRAVRKGTDPDDELLRCEKEFDEQGPLVTSFDSGTTAAIRQVRHKTLMAKAGSLNFQMDEVGSNLMGNVEVLNAFLELFDVGRIKTKLIKSTAENLRHEEVPGRTPANMALFGTPSRLLNGGKAEDEFYSMLDAGFARRCFFGYNRTHTRRVAKSAEALLDERIDPGTQQFIQQLADEMEMLADSTNMNKELAVSRDVALLFIEYQLMCEEAARELPEHEEMRKAELAHRHFKALKLAGAYAFIDQAPEVTVDHAHYAIRLAEESGEAFNNLLTRDRPYVKLAKYLAAINREVTQADLVEDLPFYKGSLSQRQDMMQLAIAYGYQNNILIKKTFNEGIEFLRGESLKVLDMNNIRIAYSDDITEGYHSESAPFDKLHLLTQQPNMHWVNHHLKEGYRKEDNAIPGFNIVVIDVDEGTTVEQATKLLEDYTYLIYTTKRHTDDEHRFRIIMPIAYELELDAKDYKEFMSSLYDWLPFDVDKQTNQRSRKWLTHPGQYYYNQAEVLDPLPFIPKTTKNEQRKKLLDTQQSLDALERWVLNNSGSGNRNNMLLKYALLLVDGGYDFNGARTKVMDLNDKMPDKLDESEIMGTIMVTVANAIGKRP